jgi:hypothetical protein
MKSYASRTRVRGYLGKEEVGQELVAREVPSAGGAIVPVLQVRHDARVAKIVPAASEERIVHRLETNWTQNIRVHVRPSANRRLVLGLHQLLSCEHHG